MNPPMLSPDQATAIDLDRDGGRTDEHAPATPEQRPSEAASRSAARLAEATAAADPARDAEVPAGLASRTLARIRADSAEPRRDDDRSTPQDAPAGSIEDRGFTLSVADAEALDAWLEAGEPAAPPARFQRFAELLEAGWGAAALGDVEHGLATRTCDRIQRDRRAQALAAQIDRFRGPVDPASSAVAGRVGFRERFRGGIRQALAAAAILFVAASLLLPALSKSAMEAGRLACMGNLRTAGSAFAQYAADHGGVLPKAAGLPSLVPTGLLGETGLIKQVSESARFRAAVEPGAEPRSGNARHLVLLVRSGGGYLKPERLICHGRPDHPAEAAETNRNAWNIPGGAGYSYQSQAGPRPLRLDEARPGLGLLADRSPLFEVRNGRLERRAEIPLSQPSQTHLGEGQNLLTASGSAVWTVRPQVSVSHAAWDAPIDRLWVADGPRGGPSPASSQLFVPTDVALDTVLVP